MTLDLSHLPTALRERAFDGNEDRIRQVRAANWVGYARHAIEADPQIRRRFDPFALPRWTENEDFRDFVCAFGKLYPLRKASNLGERGLVQRLLHASEGITGPVTRLLSLAAVEAIRTSAEHIDEAGIDRSATRLERDAA